MQQIVLGALVRDGHVLLAHRSPDKQAYPNTWDLPGGHLEADESERCALARELLEELGVQIDKSAATRLTCFTAKPTIDEVHISVWLVTSWQGEPSNEAPDEHQALRWAPINDLPALANDAVSHALVAGGTVCPQCTTRQ